MVQSFSDQNLSNKKVRIFLSGGGTGGHLYPALAVARALKVEALHGKYPFEVDIFFVGAKQGIEAQVIPKTEFQIFFIPCEKFNYPGKPLKKFLAILKIGAGFMKALYLVAKYRPDYALGFGGYTSVPFMLASSLLKWRGTRVGIWEANAKMGLANRLITSWIDDVFLVFPFYGSSPKKGKIFVFGLPIRQELIDAAGVNPPQTEEDQHPEQSQNNGKTNGSENVRKLKIFIFGGSQGARGINEAILDLAEKYKDFFSSQLDVFHQTGQLDFESVKDRYEQLGLKVQIQAFVEDMARAYHWADLVVCRSGASSVAEIALFQKPTLFVPLPIAHDHQLENAKKLIEAEACLMIEQKNLTPETLKSIFLDFIKNPKKCQEIAKKLAPFRRPDSAQLIAKQVLSSILAK